MSRPETTDRDHGHPICGDVHGHTGPPRTLARKHLVKTTDTSTDTTDTRDHGHHWGGYTPPVGPVSVHHYRK